MKKLILSLMLCSTSSRALNFQTLEQAVGQGHLLSFTTEEQGIVSFSFSNANYRKPQFANTLRALCEQAESSVSGKEVIATHFAGDKPTFTLWADPLHCAKIKQGKLPIIRVLK